MWRRVPATGPSMQLDYVGLRFFVRCCSSLVLSATIPVHRLKSGPRFQSDFSPWQDPRRFNFCKQTDEASWFCRSGDLIAHVASLRLGVSRKRPGHMSHYSHFAMRKWHRPSGHVRSTVTADSCLADQAHNWRLGMLGQDVKPQSAAKSQLLI